MGCSRTLSLHSADKYLGSPELGHCPRKMVGPCASPASSLHLIFLEEKAAPPTPQRTFASSHAAVLLCLPLSNLARLRRAPVLFPRPSPDLPMFPHLLKAVFGSSGAAHDAHAQTAAVSACVLILCCLGTNRVQDQSYDAAVRSSALEQSREDYTDRMPGTLQPGARRPDSRPHRQEQQNPRRTRYKRPNISEDEKRLIGDYECELPPRSGGTINLPPCSTPADAVYLPAPASYFDDQEALMVPPKVSPD